MEGATRPSKRARKAIDKEEPEVVLSLRRLDPLLQFLTRATGKPLVSIATLRATIPKTQHQDGLFQHVPELAKRGVLQLQRKDGSCFNKESTSFSKNNQKAARPLSELWQDRDEMELLQVGFPPPPSLDDHVSVTQQQKTSGSLHGSTKTAAKRRLAALKRSLKANPQLLHGIDAAEEATQQKQQQQQQHEPCSMKSNKSLSPTNAMNVTPDMKDSKAPANANNEGDLDDNATTMSQEEQRARQALDSLFGFLPKGERSNAVHSEAKDIAYPLPKQASYSGSNPGRVSRHGELSENSKSLIPLALFDAFGLERPGSALVGSTKPQRLRRLYKHQADAINSAMSNTHTIVCTGTGSGKSLCFLLPVMAAAMRSTAPTQNQDDDKTRTDCTSLVMFPTKALAQDQMTKLVSLLQGHDELERHVRPGIIDGDTPHSQRAHVTKNCNLILTNPDTLHAAILPGWDKVYRPLLERVRYVVIDEAHMYDGVFGAHVSLVLSRLYRLCLACSRGSGEASDSLPTFLACSATMSHPEHHLRLLCPIPSDAQVKVITNQDDGSPCSAKYFFVWNPPIMNVNGGSTGRVSVPRKKSQSGAATRETAVVDEASFPSVLGQDEGTVTMHDGGFMGQETSTSINASEAQPTIRRGKRFGVKDMYRRHAADETALLLAKAVTNNVRCIVFCKTRSLVEWVYERTISALRSNTSTQHLVSRVESYRGGYTAEARRSIERRLFQNQLLGVVGTSALELGVDIGNIDLTLHCGYPTSHNSLLQQAGRAGRGGTRLDVPSVAVMICFNSPGEQHIWRHPSNLQSRGVAALPSLPLNSGLVQSHMLCAGNEFPLTGNYPVCHVVGQGRVECSATMSDFDLFGSKDVYFQSVEVLVKSGSLVQETVHVLGGATKHGIYKTHPVISKPWAKVSLRSIEPINYSIVDVGHPVQAGKTDVIKEEAVLDTIPYSRVFYHAFPGAIIVHRGKKYEVQSMTRPPPFVSPQTCRGNYRGSCNLGAFAKRTQARYFTRPLSTMQITVVKQMERVDSNNKTTKDPSTIISESPNETQCGTGSLAGNGVVTVKREVRGYKKLSPVTRVELARFEISLPPMEFDTYAFWIDTEAPELSSQVTNYDQGVHALSHALLAVAPLFVPCTSSDIDCDHRHVECTRVILFDVRAGGAGTCAQLWKYLFRPKGLLQAAVDLLQTCPSCDVDQRYEGGCPACLQSGHCLKFNQHLSRTAGLVIGKRMLKRIEETNSYKSYVSTTNDTQSPLDSETTAKGGDKNNSRDSTNKQASSCCTAPSPRRRARAQALRNAKDLPAARERQIVVGRPSWPLDDNGRTGG